MTTSITSRVTLGRPLTFAEHDANHENLRAAIDDHIADTADAHAASAITNTPAGNIVATDVQAAITELDGQDTTLQTNINTVQTNLDTRTGTSGSVARRNRLINGDFSIAQRGTTLTSTSTYPNNDDAYILDRWILLADGNDTVDVVQESTTVPTAPGARYSLSLDVETINRKFGVLQIIERSNCQDLIGATATLSFKAKVSGTTKLDNIKCAIVSWSSTADTVTSDIVSAWNVEGTNPTLAANWTYENTPANLNVTTSWATYTVSAAIDTASTTNVGVFIWSDVTDTTLAEFVYITDVQLEIGTQATAFERLPITTVLQQCQRYFEKSFAQATAPATSVAAGQWQFTQIVGAATTQIWGRVTYSVTKRTTPTVTFYNPAAANAQMRNNTGASDCSATAVSQSIDSGFSISATSAGGSALGNFTGIHWTSDAEL